MKNPEKLNEWIKDRGVKRAWFADQVPCDRDTLRKWCNGSQPPQPIYAGRIEAITNGEVKAGEW